MSKEIEIEPYYQRKAAVVVDLLHDHKIVAPEITRKHLQAIEDYIAYIFQSEVKSALKGQELLNSINKVAKP